MADNVEYIDRVKIRGKTYYLRDKGLRDGSEGYLPDIDPDGADDGAFLCVKDGVWAKLSIADATDGGSEGDSGDDAFLCIRNGVLTKVYIKSAEGEEF